MVRGVWRLLGWLTTKLTAFFMLVLTTSMLVRLRGLLVYKTRMPGDPYVPPTLSIRPWLQQTWLTSLDVIHGHLKPLTATAEQIRFWASMLATWRPELVVTLRLLASGLVVGVVLGVALGCLMNRLGPPRVRRPAFGLTTLLSALPDLLIATFFDIVLALVARAMGIKLNGSLLAPYQEYVAPALALGLLITPYVGRVTAAAIDEVASSLYIRTAMAKGVPYRRVLLRHLGKNALIKVWTVLPVVLGLLVSGDIIVEYVCNVPGIGRGLMQILAPLPKPGYRDPYAAVLKLLPLLILFAVVAALSEAVLYWLDPRMRQPVASGRQTTMPALHPLETLRAAAGTLRSVRTSLRLPVGWPGRLREAALLQVAEWRESMPERVREARRAMKDPVLAAGVTMVGLLLLVALFAPLLAPYHYSLEFMATIDKDGTFWIAPYGPAPHHWLGVDERGRDLLSRLIFGARYAMLCAAFVAPARFLLAGILGMVAAWRGGTWDWMIGWLQVLFTAVPQILFPMVAIGVFNLALVKHPTASIAWGVFWLALPGVGRLAGSVKQMAANVLSAPFLEGGMAVGAGPVRLLRRYVFPQMAPQLFTMLTLEIPAILTMTAALGYFRVMPGGWINDDETRGLPMIPEWGSSMSSPIEILLKGQWWLWTPFMALFIAVLAFNLLGEGLRRRARNGEGWQL